MSRNDYDVIVVGGGYAGLTAAQLLVAAGQQVKLLEARDRVGGRVYTRHLDEHTYVDLGGQWIGPTQDQIYALADRLGVKTFPTYEAGNNLIIIKDRIKSYPGLIPRIDLPSLVNLDYAIKKLNRLSKQISLEQPWLSANAAYLDSRTLADFLDRNIYFSNARKVLEIGLETVFACDMSELSLLHALFYIRSGVDIEHLTQTGGGAQQDRLLGGAQQPAQLLAKQLGSVVQLNAPVQTIEQNGDSVSVTGNRFSYRARRIVVAIPPTLAGRIQYLPALPWQRDQLTQRMPMGFVVKCHAIYDRPFWREQGLSGMALADSGYLQTCFDNSPIDGHCGILTGFAIAQRGRALMQLNADTRRQKVSETFSRWFGGAAGQPVDYIDHCWADEEWSRGCYTGFMPPGVWTSYGAALAKPVGRIHWAGTETSDIWNGYIDGAIRSGQRVAKEILNAN